MTTEDNSRRELIKFLVEHRKTELEDILRSDNHDKHFVIEVHSSELLDSSLQLFTQTVSDPDTVLPQLDQDLLEALDQILEANKNEKNFTKKSNVHLRLSALPAIPWFQKKSVPRSGDTGDLIQLVATVTKVSQPRLLTWRQDVKCSSCGYVFPALAQFDQFYNLANTGKYKFC